VTLLKEIQDGATDSSVPLSTLLRKCKILSARLRHKGFAEWVDRELGGYENIDDLPEYRIARSVESRGHFFGGFGRQLRDAPLPTKHLHEEIREKLETLYYPQGVAELEALADGF
jgi:hypothetical protein